MEAVHDAKRLAELQALPLDRKIQITQTRIIEWYTHYNGEVYVSFSGGKDSTVLLHIARKVFPDIKAVFSDTGLEYPEIREFARSFDNVDVVRPKMNFGQVISTYGYPLVGKEVAEAIYYARRIRSDGSAERERRRRDLHGQWQHDNPMEIGEQKHQLIQTSISRNRRTVLTGRMPGAGVEQNGQTGEGGVFSNPEEQFGAKSQFNKEKWLPLARDVPVLISHYCCFKMKKSPMHKYQTKMGYKPILATLAEESRVRRQGWIRRGCNAFESSNPMSQPMSFWMEHDVLEYIIRYNVSIAEVYGDVVGYDEDGNEYPATDLMGNACDKLKCTGCQRTGCVFCGFGFHLEKGETRFQRMARTHPKLYEFCIGGGEWVDNPFYDPTAPKMDGEWQNWNPKKIWSRNGKGLGMGKVFDMVNEIYGKDFYRYD